MSLHKTVKYIAMITNSKRVLVNKKILEANVLEEAKREFLSMDLPKDCVANTRLWAYICPHSGSTKDSYWSEIHISSRDIRECSLLDSDKIASASEKNYFNKDVS